MSIFTDLSKLIFNKTQDIVSNNPGLAIIAGKTYGKDDLVNIWIQENLPTPNEYGATLSTLTNDITSWSNACGDYVHIKNPLYSRANGRSLCQTAIENIYQDQLAWLKQKEADEVERLKNMGSDLYMMIALVVIVMIIIVLIIRM